MSQTIKCPKCSALIDVDEQIRKDAENKVRKEFNEEEKSKLENKLRKELKTQIYNEAENSLKLKHDKDLEKERLKTERSQKALKQTEEALAKATKPINRGSPEIDGEAKKILATKKNLRVLIYNPKKNVKNLSPTFMQKTFLLQDENISLLLKNDIKIVTKVKPTDKEIDNLLFANQVCKHVKSNAIVISNNKKTLGIGGGQTSRVGSSEIACKNANKFFSSEIIGSSAASDAFFPFADGLEYLIKVGVKSVIQPCGSVRDEEVINAADKSGIAMVFTGVRNFKH